MDFSFSKPNMVIIRRLSHFWVHDDFLLYGKTFRTTVKIAGSSEYCMITEGSNGNVSYFFLSPHLV